MEWGALLHSEVIWIGGGVLVGVGLRALGKHHILPPLGASWYATLAILPQLSAFAGPSLFARSALLWLVWVALGFGAVRAFASEWHGNRMTSWVSAAVGGALVALSLAYWFHTGVPLFPKTWLEAPSFIVLPVGGIWDALWGLAAFSVVGIWTWR